MKVYLLLLSLIVLTKAHAGTVSLTQKRYQVKYLHQGNTQKMTIKGSLIVSSGESEESFLMMLENRVQSGMDLRLVLDVFGGDLAFVNKIFDVLKEKNARITTEVEMFRTCASACIPLFMVGDERIAAERSDWGFHQAATAGGYIMIPFMSEYVLRSKGVNANWLSQKKDMFRTLKITWMNPFEMNGSGIITRIIRHPR